MKISKGMVDTMVDIMSRTREMGASATFSHEEERSMGPERVMETARRRIGVSFGHFMAENIALGMGCQMYREEPGDTMPIERGFFRYEGRVVVMSPEDYTTLCQIANTLVHEVEDVPR